MTATHDGTPRLIVADLDGTLLHDGATFEERFITPQTAS